MEGEQSKLVNHGIQLNYVGLKELHFESKKLPSAFKIEDFGDATFSTARSNYNRESKTITVVSKVELSTKSGEGLHLRVELVGEFRVDESLFPSDKVEDWAQRAAFLVLFPYLREHLYGLTIRSGLPAILLPLLQIPTYKVSAPEPLTLQEAKEEHLVSH